MTSHARRERRGLALRLYRGEHRAGAWHVGNLIAAVQLQAEADRRAHLRSLRRPANPGPIFIGSTVWNAVFYGVCPDPDAFDPAVWDRITLEITPPPDLVSIPVITGELLTADDAPTGPVVMDCPTGPI